MAYKETNFSLTRVQAASVFCSAIFDGTHDSPKQQESGYKLVTSRHIKNNNILLDDAYLISEEDFVKINKRSKILFGDVLFTMIGTVGEICRITETPDFAIKNIGAFRTKISSDSLWLYYYLMSPIAKQEIEQLKRGTTQQFMGLKQLRSFPILAPSSPDYRLKQVEILRLLDEKIQANKQLSKTLEEIAQTIFKSWFIDFDPVRAKMAGQKPDGMDAVTAALFPDSMEDSELGLIPKGWEVRTVGSVGRVVTGKTPSTKIQQYWAGDIPFVTIPDMHGQLLMTKTARTLSTAGANSQQNQYVSQGSTMISCIATPGLVSYATIECQTNQQINSVIPLQEGYKAWFFWNMRAMIPVLIRSSGIGTVFANLNKSDFSNIKMIYPTEDAIHHFSQITETILEQMKSLDMESMTLSEIRDALLPRLISGELQIPEEMLTS